MKQPQPLKVTLLDQLDTAPVTSIHRRIAGLGAAGVLFDAYDFFHYLLRHCGADEGVALPAVDVREHFVRCWLGRRGGTIYSWPPGR